MNYDDYDIEALEAEYNYWDAQMPRWETEEVAMEARDLVSETSIHPIQREF